MAKKKNVHREHKPPVDFEAKKEKVGKLVTEIAQDRGMGELSRQAGVALSYISGICNFKFLPSSEVLSKIAETEKAKQAGISIDDLMIAAGYQTNYLSKSVADLSDPDTENVETDNDGRVNERVRSQMEAHEKFEKQAKGILYPVLISRGIRFEEVQHPSFDGWYRPDLVLNCDDHRVKEWCLEFKCVAEEEHRNMRGRLLNICKHSLGRTVFTEPKQGRKVSLVISDVEAFDRLKNLVGRMSYKGDMSIILVSIEDFSVISEVYLSHYDEIVPDELLLV